MPRCGSRWSGPGRDPADVDPALIAAAAALDRRALASELALDAADIRRLADLVVTAAPRAVRVPDLPGAAHLLPVEHPELACGLLLDFSPGSDPTDSTTVVSCAPM